jgi:hypothetical protein
MSANRKKTKTVRSAHPAKKAIKTANRRRPSRAAQFVASNPGRILLGASAIGLVFATLKRFV